MELGELKRSWNALDKYLEDKEPIKEEELGKLIGHADKDIHTIARLNIKLIPISLPVLVLFLLEVLLHGRLSPIYIIVILSWIPALYWNITTTRFLQQTRVDKIPPIEMISRVNRIHRWMIRKCLIAIAFPFMLVILSFIYWQMWQYGIATILFFILLWGAGPGLILRIYHKKLLNRVQEIKRSLDEPKIISNWPESAVSLISIKNLIPVLLCYSAYLWFYLFSLFYRTFICISDLSFI